jgi:WD40 repeat protein
MNKLADEKGFIILMKTRTFCLWIVPYLLLSTGCSEKKMTSLPVYHVAFSPDGKWLVGAGGLVETSSRPPWTGDGSIKVWQTSTWKPHASWREGFTDRVQQIQFTSENVFAVASNQFIRNAQGGDPYRGTLLRFWNIANKTELASLHLKDIRGNARSIGYYPPANLLALNLGYSLENVGIFTIPTLATKVILEEHKRGSLMLRFSPDGKQILSCTLDEPALRLHDCTTGRRIASHKMDSSQARYAQFSPDGKMIAVAAENGKIYVFTRDFSDILLTINVGIPPSFVTFTPNNEMIAMVKSRSAIQLYSIKTKEATQTFDGNPEGPNGCSFSPDGEWIAIGSGGHPQGGGKSPGRVRVFEVKTGKLIADLE